MGKPWKDSRLLEGNAQGYQQHNSPMDNNKQLLPTSWPAPSGVILMVGIAGSLALRWDNPRRCNEPAYQWNSRSIFLLSSTRNVDIRLPRYKKRRVGGIENGSAQRWNWWCPVFWICGEVLRILRIEIYPKEYAHWYLNLKMSIGFSMIQQFIKKNCFDHERSRKCYLL